MHLFEIIFNTDAKCGKIRYARQKFVVILQHVLFVLILQLYHVIIHFTNPIYGVNFKVTTILHLRHMGVLYMKLDNLGDRLKYLRSLKNVTITQLASDLGISAGNITRYEGNSIKPSADTIILFSQYFDISTDWILMGRGISPEQTKSLFDISTGDNTIQDIKEDDLTFDWINRLKFCLYYNNQLSLNIIEKELSLSVPLQNYLNKSSEPTIIDICKLAKFFNVSSDWLLTGVDPRLKTCGSLEYEYAKQNKEKDLIKKYDLYLKNIDICVSDEEIQLIDKLRIISNFDREDIEVLINLKANRTNKF